MAKVAFSKLALKKQEEVKTITINNNIIEVKQYLPMNEKLNLISNVVNSSHDNNFANPIKVKIFSVLEIIMAYTNITFTDKQKEDVTKLYDLLDENNIIDLILTAIPEDEYNFIIQGIKNTIDSVYTYQNSVMGILDNIVTDYNNLDFDAKNIQDKIADPNNLELLKAIITKLG